MQAAKHHSYVGARGSCGRFWELEAEQGGARGIVQGPRVSGCACGRGDDAEAIRWSFRFWGGGLRRW
jgi:hypothetical protein